MPSPSPPNANRAFRRYFLPRSSDMVTTCSVASVYPVRMSYERVAHDAMLRLFALSGDQSVSTALEAEF